MITWLRENCCATVMAILFFAGCGTLQAGGLVDTSTDRFNDSSFSDSATIDNPWWTLPAGTNFLYFAETEDGCEWNLVEILDSTTAQFSGDYAGTDARIVLDRGWLDTECDYGPDPANFADVVDDYPDPEEATYDWFAQDDDDNIWYMGEDTYDSEGSNEGSFVAGCDGAEAGIVMLAEPHKGEFYRQEFYEDEAEDWGKVLKRYSVDGHECIKTKEWTPLESGHVEHKFYCNDEGLLLAINELKGKTVMVEWIGSVDPGDIPAAPVVNPSPIPVCD